MWQPGGVDDVAWGVLTLGLTMLGGIYTWYAYRKRGLTAGMRGAAITLLPLAAYLTKTLKMFTRIVDAVTDWAASLVFNPAVWLGVVLAGVSAVLFVVSGAIDRRRGTRRSDTPKQVPGRKAEPVEGSSIVDDDMADIEAILRKRGIT
jgi:heme exporter protein D